MASGIFVGGEPRVDTSAINDFTRTGVGGKAPQRPVTVASSALQLISFRLQLLLTLIVWEIAAWVSPAELPCIREDSR